MNPHRTSGLVATFLIFVTALLTSVLVVPSAAVADEPTSSLDEIYAVLRPDNLRTLTGGTAFTQGDYVVFYFDHLNTSSNALVVPQTDFFGTPMHLIGVQNAWIERLGPDPTIPGIPPWIARKGTWYASGGEVISVENLAPSYTIPAGGRITRQSDLLYATDAFPSGVYRYHVEYSPVFDSSVIAEVSLDITFGDVTPPAINVPANLTRDATGPAGAAVEFTVSAIDEDPVNPEVICVPASGSVFPIGVTTVNCHATDNAGNIGTASFTVTVRGAPEQLAALLQDVQVVGPGTSLADKVMAAQAAYTTGDPGRTCEILNAFINQVNAQSGKSITDPGTADTLTADATRIRAVLGC